jgi:mRNA interferase RelE/StbE
LLITDNAKRDMERIPRGDLTSIDAAIAALASNPRPTQSKKLAGTEGYRRRVGNYRILYSIDDSRREVTVLRVKDRKDAYR